MLMSWQDEPVSNASYSSAHAPPTLELKLSSWLLEKLRRAKTSSGISKLRTTSKRSARKNAKLHETRYGWT
jgi:hypothetical protein